MTVRPLSARGHPETAETEILLGDPASRSNGALASLYNEALTGRIATACRTSTVQLLEEEMRDREAAGCALFRTTARLSPGDRVHRTPQHHGKASVATVDAADAVIGFTEWLITWRGDLPAELAPAEQLWVVVPPPARSYSVLGRVDRRSKMFYVASMTVTVTAKA